MSKVQAVLLVLLAAVMVDFAVENTLPPPDIKLFKFVLGQVPTFLLAYFCLALGLVVGWTTHILRVRKKRRKAAAAVLASAQEEQKPQKTQQGQQDSTQEH